MSKKLYLLIAVLAFAVMIVASLGGVQGQATPQANVAVDNDDIGGVVTGPRGPEAGVRQWRLVAGNAGTAPRPRAADRR